MESLDIKSVKQCLSYVFNELGKKVEKIEFVYGKGKRKTQIQRDYELYESWIKRMEAYETHLQIMGERNSYSKPTMMQHL